ncbi:sortase family protein [Kribbella sp. VKM Ac-2571]|uniref:class F sortase n=1 Tax=Kribbella sp. VKM Ac-2571 TaxID=2512222 RepID=UPI00105C6A29|nr:class F sortase [Kribbella sp. VKM Ac-2571]TDO54145.1 sortase family protein [Kribbella sp. VKM Ac-2571]
MRTGAAVLFLATTLTLAGCTTESGTGQTQGAQSAEVASGAAAPTTTVITPTPSTPNTGPPTKRRTVAVGKDTPAPRTEPSAEPSQRSPHGHGRGKPASLRTSTPIRVRIPAIGVDSGLMRLGLTRNGSLQVPPNGFPAGWFTGAPTPGETGPAVIAGHVHWSGRPGVFARLALLKPGDKIMVARQDRSTATFRVSRVQEYPKATFPSAAVYGDIDHAGLRLITCGGLDAVKKKYEANLVVFADLIA